MKSRNDIEKAALGGWLIVGVSGAGLLSTHAQTWSRSEMQATLRSTIAFVSTRHDSTASPAVDPERALLTAEIYLMNADGTKPRRLTNNAHFDGFPSISPDGRRIVFDTNRLRTGNEPFNTSDLFVMNTDGTGQTFLTRGSSATWASDSKRIAFHASASGRGAPIKADPGAAKYDNDIFVLNVDDFLKNGGKAKNITNSPEAIDDDPDWSPKGEKIVFTSHAVTDNHANSVTAEIYVIDLDGTGKPVRLTNNTEEERAPAWSPDGKRVVFSCRRSGPDFEICVMNADGTGQIQLTDNDVPDLTASWSPDGKKIVFHRRVGGRGQFQLFLVNADGTGEVQLTFPPGVNAFPNWGQIQDAAK
jgi:Tol biopolymer transport system component